MIHIANDYFFIYIGNFMSRRKITEEFIEDAIRIHGDKYDYSKIHDAKIVIVCKKHGPFMQSPKSHLKGNGCPICKSSQLERKVRVYLDNLNIKHEQEKRFSDCKRYKPLPYDFSVEDKYGDTILLIECQGQQHYRPSIRLGRKSFTPKEAKKLFILQQKKDKIKKDWAKLKEIPLLEIKYNLTDEDIRNKIDNVLKNLHPAKLNPKESQLVQQELDFGI